MDDNSEENTENEDAPSPSMHFLEASSSSFTLTPKTDNNTTNSQNKVPELCDPVNSTYFEDLFAEGPVEATLITNKIFQEMVEKQIHYYEQRLTKIRNLLMSLESSGILNKVYIPLNFGYFASPYFRNHFGTCPKPNPDSIRKRQNNETDAYTQPSKMWRLKEKRNLIIGVRAYSRKLVMEPHLNRREFILSKLSGSLSPEERLTLVDQLRAVMGEIERIKKIPVNDIIAPIGTKLDWLAIANSHMKGQRSPEECELMWNNFLHPSISKKPWTEEEDNSIMVLAKETKGREWPYIASKLPTKRTSVQCLQRYHQALNRVNYMGPWMPYEDQLLKQVVMSYSKYNSIPWHLVSYYMEGRSANQIKSRWYETLNPNKAFGKWSPKEDMTLLAAVAKFGVSDWTKISCYIPGRSNSQCRERYRNALSVTRGIKWTKEEDFKLMTLINSHNGERNWASYVRDFPGRTDNQLLQRYTRIIKNHPDLKLACQTLTDLPDNPEDLPELPTRTSSIKTQSCFINNLWTKIEDTLKQSDTTMKAKDALPPSLDRLLVIRSRLLTQQAQPVREPRDEESEDEELVDRELEGLFKHWHLRKHNTRPTFISRTSVADSIYKYAKKVIMKALWVSPPDSDNPEEDLMRPVNKALVSMRGPYPPLLPPCPATTRALNLFTFMMPQEEEEEQRYLPLLQHLPVPLTAQLQACHRPQSWSLDSPIAPTNCTRCDHVLEVQRQFCLLKMRLIAMFLNTTLLLECPLNLPAPPTPGFLNKRERTVYKRKAPPRQQPLKRQQQTDSLLADWDQELVCKKPIRTYSRKPQPQ